eukprot:6008885-Pyramimonas_sp.AAC.1
MTEYEALRNFNLALLTTFRDIANLGFIHRAVSVLRASELLSPLTPPLLLPAPIVATSVTC